MQITVYSTTTCPYCKMLKDYLRAKKIAFQEKLVDVDETARQEMVGVSGGFMGVPFISIVKDDGAKEIILGFDQGRIDRILGLTSS